MKAIVNGTVYTPDVKITDGVVLIEGEYIRQVGPAAQVTVPKGAERIDARGSAIVPGLIEIHMFGCLGAQLTTPEAAAETLEQIANNVAKFGVTRFLISPQMGTLEEICAMLRALALAIPNLRGGARCVGIHLEGPYLEPKLRGAFPEHVLRTPSVPEAEQIVQAANGQLRLITMAPTLPQSDEMSHYLAGQGVIVSFGHTTADYEFASRSLQSGDFALVTHIFNAMTGLHHRAPGGVTASLLGPVPVTLICDGFHVQPPVVDVLLRVKGTEGVILITDAIAGAGLPDGDYELFGQAVYVRGGSGKLATGTLAGSVLTLNRAVVNARDFGRLEFGDAVRMATLNPARLLNMKDAGELRAGACADITILAETDGQVSRTIVSGETVFPSVN